MSAKINVVNVALRLLGANSITSLEDDAHEAKVMNDIYFIARDAVLEEAEWTFATKRFLPAKEAAAPAWGWTSSFPIPSDILRVTRVDRLDIIATGSSMNRRPAEYEVEGRKILTNEDVIYCKGIRRIEDEGIYSALFDEAFAAKLAVMACYSITESNQKIQTMSAIYADTIKKAKSRDGMQGSSLRLRNKTVQQSRVSSRGIW